MELIRHNADWWMLKGKPDPRVVEYLRRSVQPIYRYFDSNHSAWFVHNKYIYEVQQLMTSYTAVVTADEDPYAVLHLRPTAPPAIIRAVWRELAKTLHPDHGGDVEAFKRVKAAYDKLMK